MEKQLTKSPSVKENLNPYGMEKITLGTEVVVSDPCYVIPTWCQTIVDDVLPGNYFTTVKKTKSKVWGNRCSMLVAVHEDYVNREGLSWTLYSDNIGVDSGQAGIFSKETYRNDGVLPNSERVIRRGKNLVRIGIVICVTKP